MEYIFIELFLPKFFQILTIGKKKAHLPQPPVAAVKPLGVQAIVAEEKNSNKKLSVFCLFITKVKKKGEKKDF